MEEKIVFEGKTKKEINIIIRYPNSSDAASMTEYINILSDERTFITYQGEKESLENETKYLNSKLKEIKNKKAVLLLVLADKKLIGISGIDMRTKTQRHIGLLGISIAKEFRGEGIGKLLLETVINEATNNLSTLEIILLGVYSKNTLALNMYKQFGFIEEGRLPNGVKLKNGYDDQIYMYKNVK